VQWFNISKTPVILPEESDETQLTQYTDNLGSSLLSDDNSVNASS